MNWRLRPDQNRRFKPPEAVTGLYTDRLRVYEAHARLSFNSANNMAELYAKGKVKFSITGEMVEAKVNVQEAIRWYKYSLSFFLNRSNTSSQVVSTCFIDLLGLYLDPAFGSFDLEKGTACAEEGIRWGFSHCAAYLGYFYFVGCESRGASIDKSKADHYFSLASYMRPSVPLNWFVYDLFCDRLDPGELCREAIRWQFISLRRNLSDFAMMVDLKFGFYGILGCHAEYFLAARNFYECMRETNIDENNIDTFLFPKLNELLTNLGIRPFDASELVYEERLQDVPVMANRNGGKR